MNNFRLKIPTEIIFGKDTHLEVGKEVKKYAEKILLVRIKKETLDRIGIYNDIMNSLKENNIEVIELDGIEPNPLLSKVHEGIKICKENNIKFILAVGGGSVMDTGKAISAGAVIEEDVWNIFKGKIPFKDSLKVGTIVTIPATGSEMNTSCVITNDETLEKIGVSLTLPTFSILNPEFTKSLPERRKAQGVVDILAHAMERYFTNIEHVELMDSMLESLMKTVVTYGKKFVLEDYDYDVASQIWYASTLAHNFTLCVGRVNDFASHRISHGLSGIYDLPHGEALSIIFPSWMRQTRNNNKNRLMQFFVRVFNVDANFLDPDETINRGLDTLESFYKELNMPTKISDTNIEDFDLEKTVNIVTQNGEINVGNYVSLDKKAITEILSRVL